jgi:glyoxylase-like metal-dependent hydrolase (beta-lactamase superfamily II)
MHHPTKVTRVHKGGILEANVYLIKNNNSNQGVLVDAPKKKNVEKLVERLKREGVNKIVLIVVTHAHFDHVHGLKKLRDEHYPNAKVLVHENESMDLAAGEFIVPKGTQWPLTVVSWFANTFLKKCLSFEGVLPDIVMEGNDDYGLEKFGLDDTRVVHTPGHSDGSVSVIVGTNKFGNVAIVGDLVWNRGDFLEVYPPFGDREKIKKQWDSFNLSSERYCTIFFPAHGEKVSQNGLNNTKRVTLGCAIILCLIFFFFVGMIIIGLIFFVGMIIIGLIPKK